MDWQKKVNLESKPGAELLFDFQLGAGEATVAFVVKVTDPSCDDGEPHEFAQGFLRFDACLNIQWQGAANARVMEHFCSEAEAQEKLTAVIREVYAEGPRMPGWQP